MIPVDGRDRFRISHHRLAMARLVTAPPRHYARGNAMPARSTRSRNDHVVCPVRPTTLCACHSELMMASSLIHSSNAPIDVGMQPSKKLDNRNEPVTWLHLCYRLANDSNAGINVSSIRAHKVETDVGIIHFVNVEHAARHERDALGTAGFQYIQRAHAVR